MCATNTRMSLCVRVCVCARMCVSSNVRHVSNFFKTPNRFPVPIKKPVRLLFGEVSCTSYHTRTRAHTRALLISEPEDARCDSPLEADVNLISVATAAATAAYAWAQICNNRLKCDDEKQRDQEKRSVAYQSARVRVVERRQVVRGRAERQRNRNKHERERRRRN